ncbi:MAG TPA: hypothetical protein VL334_13265 [Anaerolineae bacterium]|nr:hypothetical protein [Anaerolineae bacterium]
MKSNLFVPVFVLMFSILSVAPVVAAPLRSTPLRSGTLSTPLRDFVAAPCVPGATYNPACDVNQDGVVNVLDVQLTAGHWNQTGPWLSDNSHNHLGQTWTGTNTPLSLTGSYGPPDYAPLVLSSPNGHGLRIPSAGVGGVYIDSVGEYGMYVEATDHYGLFVNVAGTYGVVVNSAGADGVYAISESANHFGGYFRNRTAGGGGVRAEGGGNTAPDLILGGFGAEDDGRIYSEPSLSGSDILLYANDAVQIDLDEDNNSTSFFNIRNGMNATVWTVSETGLTVTAGASAMAVKTDEYDQRLLYAVHSPQSWFEDFGSSQLVDGEAVVLLEPIYAATIERSPSYHVFLTPLGDCALYVAEKTPAAFTVRAIDGKRCAVGFDYRIVAVSKGSEGQRLEAFAAPAD